MKKYYLFVSVALLLSLLTSCSMSNTKQTPSTSPAITIQQPVEKNEPISTPYVFTKVYFSMSDFAITVNDEQIALNDWDNELDLYTLLGVPLNETITQLEHADSHTGSFLKEMIYDEITLELFSPAQNGTSFWILSMKMNKPTYATVHQIIVGDTLEKLITTYPHLEPNDNEYILSDEEGYQHVKFTITDGVISEIYFYAEII